VRDFFDFTANKGLLTAEYVDSNRKRSEQLLAEGKILECSLANPNWLIFSCRFCCE